MTIFRREPPPRSPVSVCVAKIRTQNAIFSTAISNLELWSLLTAYRKAFQRTYYWTRQIQDGENPPPRKSRKFKLPYLSKKSSDFDEIWYTTADLELDDNQITKYDFF